MGMFQQLLSGRGKYRLPSSLRYTEGQAFIDWLTGPDGQRAIASHRRDGETLFFPNSKRKGSS